MQLRSRRQNDFIIGIARHETSGAISSEERLASGQVSLVYCAYSSPGWSPGISYIFFGGFAKKTIDKGRFVLYVSFLKEGRVMRSWGSVFMVVLFLGQAVMPESVRAAEDADVRVYMNDGSVFSGKLVELGPELIIVKKNREIFTFEVGLVKKVVTLESLGKAAKIVPVRTFPRLGFLAGTFAGATLAWWGFDSAANKEKEADVNARAVPPLLARAKELRDDADTARLVAWGATLVGAACLVVALIPEWTEKRVFPDRVEVGCKSLKFAYSLCF